MSTTPAPIRSLNAEVRGVEEGHIARMDGNVVLVKSDTEHGLTWRVTVSVVGSDVHFVCEGDRPNHGHDRLIGDAGCCPCKHSGIAARRLEREGLLKWDQGMWRITDMARSFTPAARLLPADPFAGLPS